MANNRKFYTFDGLNFVDIKTQSLNKIGNTSADGSFLTIDLSDIASCIFGTQDNPIIISAATTIEFEGYVASPGSQRQFILCVRRIEDVSVEWPENVRWAFDKPEVEDPGEVPLLPIDKSQMVYFNVIGGGSFFGVGGVCYG